jgi:hypothetical protein
LGGDAAHQGWAGEFNRDAGKRVPFFIRDDAGDPPSQALGIGADGQGKDKKDQNPNLTTWVIYFRPLGDVKDKEKYVNAK